MNTNAKSGVGKIFLAQILELVNIVVSFFSTVFAASAIVLGGAMLVLSGLFGIANIVIAIVALVFTLMGLNEAKLDNPKFGDVSTFVVINIVLSVISVLVSMIPLVGGFMSKLISLGITVLTFLVIQGIVNACAQLDAAYTGRADSIVKLAMIMMIIGLVATVISIIPFIGGFFSSICGIANFVIAIIFYIMYLSFLNSFKNS